MINNYSNKDFSGRNLSDRTDMDGLVIENTCFANETPKAKIFPENMTGVTFVSCNLDNVFIPSGNLMISCSMRCIGVQPDGSDWLLDPDTLEPISPLNGGDNGSS
jgi:hypothetical protein